VTETGRHLTLLLILWKVDLNWYLIIYLAEYARIIIITIIVVVVVVIIIIILYFLGCDLNSNTSSKNMQLLLRQFSAEYKMTQ
jgi:hypothetical protein